MKKNLVNNNGSDKNEKDQTLIHLTTMFFHLTIIVIASS